MIERERERGEESEREGGRIENQIGIGPLVAITGLQHDSIINVQMSLSLNWDRTTTTDHHQLRRKGEMVTELREKHKKPTIVKQFYRN